MPIMSTVVLGIKMDYTAYSDESEKRMVLELSDYTEKAIYLGGATACTIKVYDAYHDQLGALLPQLKRVFLSPLPGGIHQMGKRRSFCS